MSNEFWTCAAVTTASAFVSLGYSTAALRSSGTAGDSSRVPSMYALVRSLALATTAVVATLEQSVAAVEAVAVAMVLVQASDAVIGVVIRDPLKTFGPAGTALVNSAVLIRLRQL